MCPRGYIGGGGGGAERALIGAREQQDTRGRWCSRGVVHMGECSDFGCQRFSGKSSSRVRCLQRVILY